MRKIPTTMMSQHPDNAFAPYWYDSPYIPTSMETRECFLGFSEMGTDEFKWDWEGKLVDEAVVDRFYQNYYEYFQNNPLGKEKFLTFRLPNPTVETEYRLARAFMAIWSAAGLAKEVGMHSPPLFEVILPMTESAQAMIDIQEAYTEIATLNHPLFRPEKETLRYVGLIPLFEDVETIMNSGKILHEYLDLHKKAYNFSPEYLRPYIARSDPALNAGMVATVLGVKIGLSEYKKFSEDTGIPTFPILGCAALPFRGGLTPHNVRDFVKEYAGFRTLLIQSAFRYDYPFEDVKVGLRQIDELLPQTEAMSIDQDVQLEIKKIIKIFTAEYQLAIKGIAEEVDKVSKFVPKRRERVQHIGLFGYSRGIGEVKLPRAITYTCSMYSLGTPPELVGTGRGLSKVVKDIDLIKQVYKNIEKDMKRVGGFVNKNLINKLKDTNDAWKLIAQDIKNIEKIFGFEMGPNNGIEREHERLTSEIYDAMQLGKDPKDLIVKAAELRRSLG